MPTPLIDIDAFRAGATAGHAPSCGVLRFTTTAPEVLDASARTVRWTLSDGSVDRMADTISPGGWELTRYRANPVVLWAHDSSSPPIARAANLGIAGGNLVGDITFAAPEVYEFADTIFRLVSGGFIRAGSVGFLPLDWSLTSDRARPGGIDFKRQELLEFSVCPIPANPNALLEARSSGIDTRPLIAWAEKLLDGGGHVLVPRAELEGLRRAAIPSATIARRRTASTVAKDLDNVAWLASLLQALAMLEEWVEWETEAEGDDSPIADRLAAVLQTLGMILIDMTAEEVTELLDDESSGDPMGPMMMSARSKGQKILLALARATSGGGVVTRSGRVLSAKNEADLRQARDLVDNVLGQVAAEPDAAKAAGRLRKAMALRRKFRLIA